MLQRMIGAAMLRASTYEEIEADKSALPQAIGVVILVTLCGIIGDIIAGATSGGVDPVGVLGGSPERRPVRATQMGFVGHPDPFGRREDAENRRHRHELGGTRQGRGICIYAGRAGPSLVSARHWRHYGIHRVCMDIGRSDNSHQARAGLRRHRACSSGGIYHWHHRIDPLADSPWHTGRNCFLITPTQS